ncbi:MAG: nuclear transport factor 2 family protein [Aequorivita sp.]
MSKKAKEVVRDFYRSDILGDNTVLERFFHPDLVLVWNSPSGLSIKHYDDVIEFFGEIRRSYDNLRVEISHLLADGPQVTIRYKYYIRTMENPDEELAIAHFIAIFEVKDEKIYRGYQISQPVTDNDDTTESYHKVKV